MIDPVNVKAGNSVGTADLHLVSSDSRIIYASSGSTKASMETDGNLNLTLDMEISRAAGDTFYGPGNLVSA